MADDEQRSPAGAAAGSCNNPVEIILIFAELFNVARQAVRKAMPALVIGGDGVAIGKQMFGERTVPAAVIAEAVNDDDFAARFGDFVTAQVQSQSVANRDGLFDERHTSLLGLLKHILITTENVARLVARARNCNPQAAETFVFFGNPLFHLPRS